MGSASSVSLGGETVNGTIAKLTMALGGFVGMMIFARVLGPTKFGGFYILLSLVKLADRPAIGWATASKKRFSEVGFPKDEVVGAQLLINGVWLFLLGTGALLASEWLRSYTGLIDAPVLFVILAGALVLYVSTESLVQARGLVGVSSWVDTLRSYLTLPLQILLVFAGLGAAGMVYGLAGATVLTLPMLWYYVAMAPAAPSWGVLRNLATYAQYSIPASMLGRAYSQFDILLLGFILAPAAAGHYEVALKFTAPAMFVADTAGSGLMARVSNRRSNGRDVTQDISNTLSFAGILSIPIFFGALAISRPLVLTFFGGQFAEASLLLIGLALYRVLQSQTSPMGQAIAGLDKPRVNMQISAVALTLNVIAGVGLTLWIGMIGVVLATILAESLKYVTFACVLREEISQVVLVPRTLREQFLAATVMFIVVWTAHQFLIVRSWVDLSVLIVLGGVIYGGLLLLISPQLRLTIGSVLRGSRIGRYVPKRILNW